MGTPTLFCARIESRPGDTLADFLSSMRVWLDRRRIDVVSFDSVPATRGTVAFDVYFRSEKDIVLFRDEFGKWQLPGSTAGQAWADINVD